MHDCKNCKMLGFYLFHVTVSFPASAIWPTCGWEQLETLFIGSSLHDSAGATDIGIWQLAQVQLPSVSGTKKLCYCCTGTADAKADDRLGKDSEDKEYHH